MKTNIRPKPNLVDYKSFEKKVVFRKINPIEIHEMKIFYLNLIMILIIILGGMFLYHRYENKEKDKEEREKKIKSLYEQMKKY